MASTQLNASTASLPRGNPVTVPFTATTQVYQFSVRGGAEFGPGPTFLSASVVGGTGTTGIALEASLDGGTSWFSVVVRTMITAAGSTAANLYGITTLNSDPAVIAAASYDISGLVGALLRIGVTGISAGTANVTLQTN